MTIQDHGWAGPKEELNAPLLFNLRRDPYEKANHESGMYVNWMGKKMWIFGPALRVAQRHLQTLQDYPPRPPYAAQSDADSAGASMMENQFSQ